MGDGHHHDAGLSPATSAGIPNLPMVLASFALGDSPGIAMPFFIHQLPAAGPTEDETGRLLQGTA
jgi:hypothetical protein